ncbi:hypothetical protein ACJ41P_10335 [Azospirillum argentinense]|uniref:Small CPxCG-related zinc finger protein n=1 Tax=Azospirillum argentinense TaxID=2970906 RepID=A0ABW8V558_9PROT
MKPEDFDTLPCPACETPVPPKSVSGTEESPTVAYHCSGCGRSWRINPDGDETHVRHPES